MLDGGLELLPAGKSGVSGVAAEQPVAPGATVTYRYYVPERCARPPASLSFACSVVKATEREVHVTGA